MPKKGGWRTTTSIMRYEQATCSLNEYGKIDVEAKGYMEQAARDLVQYLLVGKLVPTPPKVGDLGGSF